MTGEELSLAKVFRDAKKHQEVAAIIRDHLQDNIERLSRYHLEHQLDRIATHLKLSKEQGY